MNTAQEIRTARLEAGLTQAELAERAGTSQARISSYESGTSVPSVMTFERLLRASGRSLAVRTSWPVVAFSKERLERNARVLDNVLDLADAIPVRHRPLVRPKLPGG